MNQEQVIIDRVNRFFENHTFEIYYLQDGDGEYPTSTNIKVEITGIREYISMGDKKDFVTLTLYVLPSSELSDAHNSIMSGYFGRETKIETYDSGPYQNLVWVTQQKVDELLKYFSLPSSMITKVINKVEPRKMNESLIVEGELDKLTKKLVKDVVLFFKHQRVGEFSLPEDMGVDDMVYTYPGFDGFTIKLNLELSDKVDTIDVDAELRYNDGDMNITIISNPKAGYSVLEELTYELNEVIRHELEHVKQHDDGYNFPKNEPKNPEKYYTQQHELEAQRAGFNKKSKTTKLDFETLVRSWFEKNSHKHRLNPSQKEKVIQKILNNND
jgi:hypothetical protein